MGSRRRKPLRSVRVNPFGVFGPYGSSIPGVIVHFIHFVQIVHISQIGIPVYRCFVDDRWGEENFPRRRKGAKGRNPEKKGRILIKNFVAWRLFVKSLLTRNGTTEEDEQERD